MIVKVTLRLQRRFTVQRRVEAIEVKTVVERVKHHLAAGAIYGDCQYATHLDDPPGHHSGIVSCYHRVDGEPDPPDPSLASPRSSGRISSASPGATSPRRSGCTGRTT